MKQKWIAKDGENFKRVAENPIDEDKTNLNMFVDDPNYDTHEKKKVD